MLVSYQWLQDYLGSDIPAPEAVAELLTFHAFEVEAITTVEDDVVIDVDVLPNRSSDCLSHRGIARELATLLDRPLQYDPLKEAPALPSSVDVTVKVVDPVACPRFTALVVEGVVVGPSPEWLQKRLRALGQRPINTVVDATNYVMYALGQPLHAYDADRFPRTDGQWQFVVRPAQSGETIALLSEGGGDVERVLTLAGGETLIVDGSSDTPIGLAGVKGGQYAGVDSATTRVIIEAAHFNPELTRRTARGNNIVIDASKRFENKPSPELPPYAQHVIAKLLADIAGGTVVGYYDMYPEPQPPATVAVSPVMVNRLLGLSLEPSAMISLLERAGITVQMVEEVMHCTGPFERTDLLIPEDFIEEIGRIYGYEHIAGVVPSSVPLTARNSQHYYSERVRAALCAEGFSEVITSSFRKKDQVKLFNALASDKNHLRSDLRKNIEAALKRNVPHTTLLGTADTRLFEIGTVMCQGEGDVVEHVSLALGAQVRSDGYSGKEDAIVASARAAVESALGCCVEWDERKGVAEANLQATIATLPAPTAYERVEPMSAVQYQPFSVYPAVARDIAVWVPEAVAATTVAATLLASVGVQDVSWSETSCIIQRPVMAPNTPAMQVVRLDLFDTFPKAGQVSYAFRLVFQSDRTTLTDQAVNQVMEATYTAAREAGWQVR